MPYKSSGLQHFLAYESDESNLSGGAIEIFGFMVNQLEGNNTRRLIINTSVIFKGLNFSLKASVSTIVICKGSFIQTFCHDPMDIYLRKVSNRNTRTRCEIYSKLTIKTPERR